MRILLILSLAVIFVSTGAAANEPAVTISPGPVGPFEGIRTPDCDGDLCQYGFQDDSPTSGYTLDANQQLGIKCTAPFPGAGIVSVGFYSGFWVVPGDMDIVVLNSDTGEELSRTMVYIAGGSGVEYDFDIPATHAENACVMLCPVGDTWGVTGEDMTTGPFGNTFYSNSCFCDNEFTNENLTIWACWSVTPTPTETETWGVVKSMYR